MQFSTLYGEVAANFPTANLTRCQLGVNAAYQEWMAARQWSYREITVASLALTAGLAKYTLGGTAPVVTDFDGLIDVGLEMSTGGEVRPLVECAQQDFDAWFGHQKTNSEPAVYCVRGGLAAVSAAAMISGGQQQLQVSPPPIATATHGQALQIAYFRSVASMEMSAATDVPLMPAQFHYALVLGGNAYVAAAIGNTQRAVEFRQLFQQRLQEAISSDMGMRLRDHVVLVQRPGASVYPITGQDPSTFDLSTRPYDARQ